ncbi:hypothetical protein B484DRAFT_460129 [Ochromonadaceae sp. CCMP2298]|nr:hypothetical protein B484DRAFT_460129 [Ochromonadaceae sp. CCMP2298]
MPVPVRSVSACPGAAALPSSSCIFHPLIHRTTPTPTHHFFRPLEAGDEPGRPEKYCRTFKVLSKEKSFFLRASSVERKDAWVKAISEAAREQQLKQGALRVLAEMAPIWQADQSMCQICSKQFTFFIRKHHCRNW